MKDLEIVYLRFLIVGEGIHFPQLSLTDQMMVSKCELLNDCQCSDRANLFSVGSEISKETDGTVIRACNLSQNAIHSDVKCKSVLI